jgi:hypothetical protein
MLSVLLLRPEKSISGSNQVHLTGTVPGLNGRGISPEDHRKSTPSHPVHPTLAHLMKRAFVIRLSPEANPGKGKFQGHIEEVDTGRELRFRSLEEFLAFVQDCIDADSSDGRNVTGKP